MNIKRLFVAASLAALPVAVVAAELRPAGFFVQAGLAEHRTYSVTAGLVWPWSWRRELGRAEATGLTEAFLSHWSGRIPEGRHALTQVGVLPLVRLRPDAGRSDWFLEGGIGLSVMDHAYHTTTKRFGSTFNFVDVVGVGRSLGPDRRRELGLRFMHVSNGHIKEPNPGENFLQLRYAVKF